MGSLLATLREPATIRQAQRDGCPRPDKRGYPTKSAAKTALRTVKRQRRADTSIEVYFCGCSVYHLGNPHSVNS